MSSRLQRADWFPAASWWLAAATVLTTGIAGNWFLAAGLLVVLLVMTAWPFDFMTAFLVAMGCATFVHYEGGRVTYQFSILLVATVFMLFCYVLSVRNRSFDLPWSSLSVAVLLYVGLSLANFVRGLAAGYPWRFATTEVVAALGFGITILVANAFIPRRDIRFAFAGMLAIAFASAALGFYIFSVIHVRTSGVYFLAVPGIMAIFLLNLALRSKTLTTAFAWVLVSLPLFLHQFLSFRRGLWLGLLGALLVTIPLFTGWGRGSGERWRRAGIIFGSLTGLATVGSLAMALMYGQTDILEQAGGRFASIGGTEAKAEHWSNLERLTQAGVVLQHIARSPWIGHGLGYTYLDVKHLIREKKDAWWVDQNSLLILLKMGVVGLAVFFWMLWVAFALNAREARRRSDPWQSSWFATAAAATVCMAIFAQFDWPFAQVYTTYMFGLLWGGAIAIRGGDSLRFRWNPVPAPVPPPRDPESRVALTLDSGRR